MCLYVALFVAYKSHHATTNCGRAQHTCLWEKRRHRRTSKKIARLMCVLLAGKYIWWKFESQVRLSVACTDACLVGAIKFVFFQSLFVFQFSKSVYESVRRFVCCGLIALRRRDARALPVFTRWMVFSVYLYGIEQLRQLKGNQRVMSLWHCICGLP